MVKKNKNESIILLGEKIDKKNFPILYSWAKSNPATLKTTLESIVKQYGSNIANAMISLESDLQHG